MLSKNTVLRTRKAIEMSYDFRADIFEKKKVVVSSETNFEEVMVQSDVCCRLSYSNISSNSENEADSDVTQVIKLFMAPEINVKPGSKILVKGVGGVVAYKSSGRPAVYPTHQEILLDLVEDKA